jgi:chemotaxis protein MotA
MDIASLVGLIIGMGCFGAVLFEVSHGNFMMFFSMEGVLCVGGGTTSVLFMAMPLDKIKAVGGYVRRFMFHKGRKAADTVMLVSELANLVRKDGILTLESRLPDIEKDDPFLAAGLRMTVDGMDPAAIESTLRMQVLAMQERHKAGKKFFDLIKTYGPGWALVGTLIGQIGMFGNLEGAEVGKLGKMLAIAVCATMYGTVIANAVAGPIGDKLAMRSGEEILNREMVLQGILSIQSGDNPRLTADKMIAFIPFSGRAAVQLAN